MMGVFCMTDELVSSLPSCGEGGQLLRNGSPGSPGHSRRPSCARYNSKCLHMLTFQSRQQPREIYTIILISQMKKLRAREVNCLAQGHTANKQWSQDLNPGSLAPEMHSAASARKAGKLGLWS